MKDEKRECLERWLFNYAEPPFWQSYEELAEEYMENLIALHSPEDDWIPEDYACEPDEIRQVIEERLRWLEEKED